jgi:hypothetical protein
VKEENWTVDMNQSSAETLLIVGDNAENRNVLARCVTRRFEARSVGLTARPLVLQSIA